MFELSFFAVFIGMFIGMLVIQYLDAKYDLQINAWMEGTCSNPFEFNQNKQKSDVAQDNAQLMERIEILEKIVSEPAYELNQKLNRL